MVHVASAQGANSDQFKIAESTATPIGYFSGREIPRLEIGAEGSGLLKIAAKINNSKHPTFESQNSSLGYFQINVTVKIGNENYDINISSCAKRLGITREAVFELAKTAQLETQLKNRAADYNNIKKGFEEQQETKPYASQLADFILTNKENIKNAIDQSKPINTGISIKGIGNFELTFIDGYAYLHIAKKERDTMLLTVMPQSVYKHLELKEPAHTITAPKFLNQAEDASPRVPNEPVHLQTAELDKDVALMKSLEETKLAISLQPDQVNDPLNAYIDLNSALVEVDTESDRTYFYSNQDYTGIGEELIKIKPIGQSNESVALFVGEGNIFGLLPSLDNHVSQVLVIDRDDKLIAYKRRELEALKNAQTLDEFYSLMIDHAALYYPDYKKIAKSFAIIGLHVAFKMPELDEEQFIKMKQAVNTVRVDFLQIDIMDHEKVKQLARAIEKSAKVITVINRTNLMEYGTAHMQMKFFKKEVPAMNGILDSFQFLPIDPNAIALFGVSEEKKEKTYLVQGLNQSLETEQSLIKKNKKYHDKTQ